MDALNKTLVAFAACTCGRAVCAEASHRGLNPNVWFNNVEQIASERIGRETVQYVSHLYKYYGGYQLALQELDGKKAQEVGVRQRWRLVRRVRDVRIRGEWGSLSSSAACASQMSDGMSLMRGGDLARY